MIHRNETKAMALVRQVDPKITDEEYQVRKSCHQRDRCALRLVYLFQKIKETSQLIENSFEEVEEFGRSLMEKYPSFSQFCQSIQSTIDLHEETEEKFHSSIEQIDVRERKLRWIVDQILFSLAF